MILDATQAANVQTAALALQRGALLGLPTETVYGLAADADNATAVAHIFSSKGRPSDHPLIVHIESSSAANRYACNIPPFAEQLMAAFWPGPLTLILPRRPGVAEACSGGQGSIGLRCPSHPAAQAVLAACQQLHPPIYGLAAPSANRFGRISPTTAQHVASELGSNLLVLDAGPCTIGIESTIIDCTRGTPVLLRPGAITGDDVQRTCGLPLVAAEDLPDDLPAPRAAGTLAAHYAPKAPLRLMDSQQLQAALDVLGADAANLAIYSRTLLRTAASRITLRRMPQDAAATAQQLFAVLRSLDDAAVKLIWVEAPPETPEWEAVRDRLERAAAAA